ncbi:hypothetical protein AKJ16_DCAP17298, partial [Drosera capensis]
MHITETSASNDVLESLSTEHSSEKRVANNNPLESAVAGERNPLFPDVALLAQEPLPNNVVDVVPPSQKGASLFAQDQLSSTRYIL